MVTAQKRILKIALWTLGAIASAIWLSVILSPILLLTALFPVPGENANTGDKTVVLVNGTDQYLVVTDSYHWFGEMAPGAELRYSYHVDNETETYLDLVVADKAHERVYDEEIGLPEGRIVVGSAGASYMADSPETAEARRITVTNSTFKYLTVEINGETVGKVNTGLNIIFPFPSGSPDISVQSRNDRGEIVFSKVYKASELKSGNSEIEIPAAAISPWSVIGNALGATNVISSSATLNGYLNLGPVEYAEVHICWGEISGGQSPDKWAHDENLGQRSSGHFSVDVSGLKPGKVYYYCCYAVDGKISIWADPVKCFPAR